MQYVHRAKKASKLCKFKSRETKDTTTEGALMFHRLMEGMYDTWNKYKILESLKISNMNFWS